MKKNTTYLLLALIVGAVIVLFVNGNFRNRKLNERITLRRQDKIPYGTWVVYHSIPALFPGATVYPNRREPGYWDSVLLDEPGQAFIAITDEFNADDFEMGKLIRFAENGNDVFVSTKYVTTAVENLLRCKVVSGYRPADFFGEETEETDSLTLTLDQPPFGKTKKYLYPGKQFDGFFSTLDKSVTDEWGTNTGGVTNFIHLRAGKGNFYLHLAPLAFSNYFLLHKANIEYFQKVFSAIRPDVRKIIWDEYYLHKRPDNEPRQQKHSWLAILFRYPAFKAALLTAILALLVYILLEMRRKQQYIPVIKRPRNDSMDFVRTIGRLYYEKSDHRNLCRKMATYFLEHVRNKYKLATGTLDETFIKNLQYKSGVPEPEIQALVSFIRYSDEVSFIPANEVMGFYKQLESFYAKG